MFAKYSFSTVTYLVYLVWVDAVIGLRRCQVFIPSFIVVPSINNNFVRCYIYNVLNFTFEI